MEEKRRMQKGVPNVFNIIETSKTNFEHDFEVFWSSKQRWGTNRTQFQANQKYMVHIVILFSILLFSFLCMCIAFHLLNPDPDRLSLTKQLFVFIVVYFCFTTIESAMQRNVGTFGYVFCDWFRSTYVFLKREDIILLWIDGRYVQFN